MAARSNRRARHAGARLSRATAIPFRSSPLRSCRRRTVQLAVAFNDAGASFDELKERAEAQYLRAKELAPQLSEAQAAAAAGEAPSADAEQRWKAARERLEGVSSEAHDALEALKKDVLVAAGGEAAATHALAAAAAADRLEHFHELHQPVAEQWQAFPPQQLPLLSIPGAVLVAQLAACEAEDGGKHAVLSLALAVPFLSAVLHSALLHWWAPTALIRP